MSTPEKSPEPDLAIVAVGDIIAREGWNPRSGDDQAEADALAASVQAQGLLQPLLVERTEAGPVLIDGHRRLAAAISAGIGRVAVVYRDSDGDEAAQLAAALAANLRRRGLGPLEEARAFRRAADAGWPQRRIAEAVGCSARHVSERLRLLRLPEPVQEAIQAGALPLAAVPRIEGIAKVSSAVAQALAAAISAGAIDGADVTDRPDDALAELADAACERPLLVALPGRHELAPLLDPDQDGDSLARAETAGVHAISLDADDMDAARAFGSLIEFPGREDRYWRRGWVADRDWLRDRVRLHIERAEQRAAERAGQDAERRADEDARRVEGARSRAVERGEDPDAVAATIETENEETRRRRERREADEDRCSARLANLDLGRRATLAYDEPAAITIEMARAVALTALHHHAQDAAQGLRLTQERLQHSETRTTKAGATRERVSYVERQEAEEALREWIEGARTPEQVIGRVVQALVVAFNADQAALPRSERRPADVPGRWGGGVAAGLPDAIDALARAVLPERLAVSAREHAPHGTGTAGEGAEPAN